MTYVSLCFPTRYKDRYFTAEGNPDACTLLMAEVMAERLSFGELNTDEG